MSAEPDPSWTGAPPSVSTACVDSTSLFKLCGMGEFALIDQQFRLSPDACRLLALPSGTNALWLEDFIDGIDPDDRRSATKMLTSECLGALPLDFRFRILVRGEQPLWRRVQAVYDRATATLSGAFSDIDAVVALEVDQTNTQEMLKRTQQKLDLAMLANRDAIWDWDIHNRELFFSPHLAGMLGLTGEQSALSNRLFRERLHPEDMGLLDDHLGRHFENDTAISLEFRLRDAEGVYRWFHCTGTTRYNEQGHPAGVAGGLRDIHDYREATEQLQIALYEQQHMSKIVQQMSARVVQAQEEDRRHIARELHDEIGQSLTATIMELEFWKGRPMQEEARQSAVTEVRRALGQVRDLSLNLRPSLLDSAGLEAAMRWYLERQAKAGQFHLSLAVEGVANRPSPVVEITAFRITQEAITNIVRHANARHVEVSVKTTAKDLSLRISDDGNGFEVGAAIGKATQGSSLGLLGMQERAQLVGGRCDIASMPGMGSVITVRLPLRTDA